MEALAGAANTLSEGEVIQMKNAHDPSVDEKRYFEVIERKTSVLFSAAARMAASIANAAPEQEQGLVDYALALGNAFQIVDDILDYSGDPSQSGKNIGADFSEGKVTLPVIYALEKCSAEERHFIEAAIRNGEGDFEKISEIIKSTGAIEKCKQRALEEFERGKNALSSIPSCIYKNSLLQCFSFVIERNS